MGSQVLPRFFLDRERYACSSQTKCGWAKRNAVPFGLRYSRAPPRGVPVGGRPSSKRPRAHRRLEEILDGAIRFSRATVLIIASSPDSPR